MGAVFGFVAFLVALHVGAAGLERKDALESRHRLHKVFAVGQFDAES